MHGVLGKNVSGSNKYDKSLLFGIPRLEQRLMCPKLLNCLKSEIMLGYDIWKCYEVSWLNTFGKPIRKVMSFCVDSNSEKILESKSLKLYLNSLNNEKFISDEEFANLVSVDVSNVLGISVNVQLYDIECFDIKNFNVENFDTKNIDFQESKSDSLSIKSIFMNMKTDSNLYQYTNLDDIDVQIDDYECKSSYLNNVMSGDVSLALSDDKCSDKVNEFLSSDLFRSKCPVTGQPDWARIIIKYYGNKINHESLLKYLISFRNFQSFHEHCIEIIFSSIMHECSIDELAIVGNFERRGGISISPVRYVANYI